jgi:glycosyltransferase 2 family protein
MFRFDAKASSTRRTDRPRAVRLWRDRAVAATRWLVAVGLLGWLLAGMDRRALVGSLARLPPGTIALLVLLSAGQQLLLTERLFAALSWAVIRFRAGSRPLTRAHVLEDQLVASAYGLVLPSTVGGDVARYVLIGRYLGATEARPLGLLAIDRLVGLGALAGLPLILMAGRWTSTSSLARPAALLLGTVLLFLWQGPRVVRALARWTPARLLAVRRLLASVELGLEVPLGVRLTMFGWSLAYQAAAGAFCEVAAHPWHLGPALHQAVWVGVPLALAATVLPVSIGGLGLRETLFAMVFESHGLRAEQGTALGLIWGAQGLLSGLLGALLHAVRRPRPPPRG